MLDILLAGGWLILPLLICSVVMVAIILERYWFLQTEKLAPAELTRTTWSLYRHKRSLTKDEMESLKNDSALGTILAAGIANKEHGREVVKDSMQVAATHQLHQMERFLGALGVIATIAPLIGLLGTVTGMIDVFAAIVAQGSGDAAALAGGISKALITTAVGLSVAIPATIFERALQRRVDNITIDMEKYATQFVDAMFAQSVIPAVAKRKPEIA